MAWVVTLLWNDQNQELTVNSNTKKFQRIAENNFKCPTIWFGNWNEKLRRNSYWQRYWKCWALAELHNHKPKSETNQNACINHEEWHHIPEWGHAMSWESQISGQLECMYLSQDLRNDIMHQNEAVAGESQICGQKWKWSHMAKWDCS